MKSHFLKTKPCAILLHLKDSQQQWYPSKLARAAGCSYVHTVNLIAVLKRNGIIALDKKGRQNCYRLTENGAHLAAALDEFAKKCDAAEAEAKPQVKAEEKPLPSAQIAQAAQKEDARQEKPLSDKAAAPEKK
ncbi:MAG: hypothetical protein WCT52_03630 [Candidatus Micrarchaeia archaeon]